MQSLDRKFKSRLIRRTDRSLFAGVAWNGLARWSGQFVSWAVLIYAARVLTPEDFGYVAMAMVPIGLARMVEDLGLDAAIVQNERLDKEQISALGGLAFVVGLALSCIYLLIADVVADVYNESRVANIVRVLSLLFVLDALQIVPRALLQKRLQFGRLAFINGAQLVSSALVLGLFAFLGLSYWALVFNHVLSNILIVVMLLIMVRHPLKWPRNWQAIAHSVKFGGHMLASRIAWYGCTTADQFFLGRYSGAHVLGSFNFSMTFARVPVDEFSSLLSGVVPGVFSSVQQSRKRLTRYLHMLSEAVSYITFPATIGIALVAPDFVPVVMGEQWSAVILPMQTLGIYTCIISVTTLWSHILIWTGHARQVMWLTFLALLILPPAFYFGSKHGALGVALAWTIAHPITLIPTYWILNRILQLKFRKYLLSLGPALISTALMCAGIFTVRELVVTQDSHLIRLITDILVGVLSYGLSMLLLFGGRVRRIYGIIRRSFKSRV